MCAPAHERVPRCPPVYRLGRCHERPSSARCRSALTLSRAPSTRAATDQVGRGDGSASKCSAATNTAASSAGGAPPRSITSSRSSMADATSRTTCAHSAPGATSGVTGSLLGVADPVLGQSLANLLGRVAPIAQVSGSDGSGDLIGEPGDEGRTALLVTREVGGRFGKLERVKAETSAARLALGPDASAPIGDDAECFGRTAGHPRNVRIIWPLLRLGRLDSLIGLGFVIAPEPTAPSESVRLSDRTPAVATGANVRLRWHTALGKREAEPAPPGGVAVAAMRTAGGVFVQPAPTASAARRVGLGDRQSLAGALVADRSHPLALRGGQAHGSECASPRSVRPRLGVVHLSNG